MKFNAFLYLILVLFACLTSCQTGSDDDTFVVVDNNSNNSNNSLDTQLGTLLALANASSPNEPVVTNTAKFELGRNVFFDKELSGNRNISCGTCHPLEFMTGDGIPLSIGHFGEGVGTERTNADGLAAFIARNSPHVSDRADGQLETMFWDGRVQLLPDGTISTPAGDKMLDGLDNTLAAVDMFPATDRNEMRGRLGEPENDPANELVLIADDDEPAIWAALTARFVAIPEYLTLLQEAYPEVTDPADFTFAHISNGIAEFQKIFSRYDTPFDNYLRGDTNALTTQQKRGAVLFFGAANCSSCHNGPFLTDLDFHHRVVPQLGPGKDVGPDGTSDFGREEFTGLESDRYKFRTPPLRNVAITGPWFHDGAFTTLEGAVRHELDPVNSALNYDETQLPVLFQPEYRDAEIFNLVATADPIETAPIVLSDSQVQDIVAFLESLTSPTMDDMISEKPATVPSGLPVD